VFVRTKSVVKFLTDADWHPLGGLHYAPPMFYKSFASDAAGCSGYLSSKEKIGCGNIGFDEEGVVIFANQFFWPFNFAQNNTDNLKKKYGIKTTTLEFIGLIIPFLLIPEKIANQYVVVRVDNSGCFFSWINRCAAGDETVSIFVKALHLISCYLSCEIHIEHLPRVSNWEAMVVDRLSRKSTTTYQDKRLLNSFVNRPLPSCLIKWLNNPEVDWGLADELLNHVKELNMK
jgi:hypothetical protein